MTFAVTDIRYITGEGGRDGTFNWTGLDETMACVETKRSWASVGTI